MNAVTEHNSDRRRAKITFGRSFVAEGSPRRISMGPAHKKVRWEPYFICGVILIVALIFGAGAVIANQKSKVSLERTFATSTTQATASTVPTVQENSSITTAAKPTVTPHRSVTERDVSFALDPDRRNWNFVGDDRKVFYLTIDDGPSEKTQEILDILDRYGCKATFFVTGQNEEYYPMIAEAYNRGHTIGLHTYSHDYETIYSSIDNYFSDLDTIGNIVRQQIGYVPSFIRFPGGSSNEVSANYTSGIMSELVEAVQARGYQYYDWNVSCGDGSDHTAEELIAYACEPNEKQNIIMLCHDSAAKATTVEALPAIIEHYQGLGYSFEAIDPSTWVYHHSVNN